jgi:hypothetical protein
MTERDDRRLEAAVALGIITAAQAGEIRAIAPTRTEEEGAAREAPRAFNAAMLAYVLGAITVVIAMGWFLADRWKWLGTGGVLAVSLLYAALFLLTAHRLRRQGYATAAGFATLLAVMMAPVAAVAFNDLVGWFKRPPGLSCGYPEFDLWGCRGEEIFTELVTAAAALLALRRTRFSLLVLPLAMIALRFVFHIADTFGRNGSGDASGGWVWVIGASLMAASAYAIDRRQQGDEDFGVWLHIAAVVCAAAATLQLLSSYREMRHFLVPGAFVAFAAALTLRRFVWLLLGMGWFIGYLGWLASDVFRDSPLFPVVLAALGISVIATTVWVQRNAATLVKRFGTVTSDGRPRFPGGVPLLLGPALVALLLMPQAMERDAERRADEQWRQSRYRLRFERERAKAAADSMALRAVRVAPPVRAETLAVPRP